jgi:hypothetical protein
VSGLRIQDRLLRVVTDGLDAAIDAWVASVLDRHLRDLRPAEFVRAVRALSARYVERRAELPSRSPIDSAGKRAAFAAFYAPLHMLTVRAVLRELPGAVAPLDAIIDLGCGTGVAGAAWALSLPTRPTLTGVDLDAWSLDEALWNWRALDLRGRTRRLSMGKVFDAPVSRRTTAWSGTGLILGWSVNELTPAERKTVLPHLLAAHASGARLLVLEPLAKTAVPWWHEWASAFTSAGGRADEWRLAIRLPERLRTIDTAAGFRRDTVGVRTLWLGA